VRLWIMLSPMWRLVAKWKSLRVPSLNKKNKNNVGGAWRAVSGSKLCECWQKMYLDQNIVQNGRYTCITYTVSGKKGTNSILGITSSHTGRFSKFFQCHNLLEICNKTLLNFLPHLKRVATLPCEKLMSEN